MASSKNVVMTTSRSKPWSPDGARIALRAWALRAEEAGQLGIARVARRVDGEVLNSREAFDAWCEKYLGKKVQI